VLPRRRRVLRDVGRVLRARGAEGVGPVRTPAEALELHPRGLVGRRGDGDRAPQALAALRFDVSARDDVEASGDVGRGHTARVPGREIQARAIRRCGELLRQVAPDPKPGRPKNGGDAPTITRAAKQAGLSRDQRVAALRVANVPADDFEDAVEADEPATVTELAERGGYPRSHAAPDRSSWGILERLFGAPRPKPGALSGLHVTRAQTRPNMMPGEAEDVLDRQLNFLLAHAQEDFYAQLGPYLDALESDPRIDAHLRDLLQEANDVVEKLRRVDTEIAGQLVAVRREFVRRAPELDDSSTPEPEDGDNPDHQNTLAYFDRKAAAKRPALDLNVESVRWRGATRSRELLGILKAKLRSDDARWQDLRRKVYDLDSNERYAVKEFMLALRTSPGVALARLFRARSTLNPAPRAAHQERPDFEPVTIYFHPAQDALFGSQPLDKNSQRQLEGCVDLLRDAAKRSYEDLRRRLGTVQSHRALVARYKLRCESYDRERLGRLADGKSNPENLLVAELARYLFDAGLTPLLSAQVGGFRPDNFQHTERWTFYLEAKQYASARAARKAVRDGVKQVWDTAAVLKSLGLREAFLVIFRRAGPLCLLPDVLRVEGLSVFPVVVDIASPKESGSQQHARPIEFTGPELLPTKGPVRHAKRRRGSTKDGARKRK
jgi:hypothetical protein